MANYSSGLMKVVTKNKNIFERLEKILNYNDDEYCIYGCDRCEVVNYEPYEEDGYWIQEYLINGKWTCEPFLNYGENKDNHLMGYARNEDGTLNMDVLVEKSAHFTDLSHLAKELGFGAMFWTTEIGCCIAEKGVVNHNGDIEYEQKPYEEIYPKDENGDLNLNEEPEIKCGFGDEFKEWLYDDEIYGDVEIGKED